MNRRLLNKNRKGKIQRNIHKVRVQKLQKLQEEELVQKEEKEEELVQKEEELVRKLQEEELAQNHANHQEEEDILSPIIINEIPEIPVNNQPFSLKVINENIV
jgi:hypothetical protein